MKIYTGTKTLKAAPMTLGAYNIFRGWATPGDEDPNADGYLVEYSDGGKANTEAYAGYVRWSPKDVFERTYFEAMPVSGNAIEAEIKAKGMTAPRVTPEHIEACIVSEHYFTAGDALDRVLVVGHKYPESLDLLTFCVLVLQNGFTVTGESACASPENFDAEIGKKLARANAVQKIWMLEGYLLRQRLHEQLSMVPMTADSQ